MLDVEVVAVVRRQHRMVRHSGHALRILDLSPFLEEVQVGILEILEMKFEDGNGSLVWPV